MLQQQQNPWTQQEDDLITNLMNVKGMSAQHISSHYLPGREQGLIEHRMQELIKLAGEKEKEKEKKEKEPKLDKKTSAAIKEFTM